MQGFSKIIGIQQVPPPFGSDDKLKLNMSLIIQEILDVNENEGYILTKVEQTRTWYDIQLKYQNLKRFGENMLSPSELDYDYMWKPWIIFQNIANKEKMAVTDKHDYIRMIPHPGFIFKIGDNSNPKNTYIFDGSMNALECVREWQIEWLCDFHMEWYPFDSQSCTMQFRNHYSSIDFLPSNLTYIGPKELPQHFVRDVKMCSRTIEDDQGIVVEVILGRPIFSFFLTTTLPTAMLTIISQLATTFSNEYLDMVIEVNLTVFLVLATL